MPGYPVPMMYQNYEPSIQYYLISFDLGAGLGNCDVYKHLGFSTTIDDSYVITHDGAKPPVETVLSLPFTGNIVLSTGSTTPLLQVYNKLTTQQIQNWAALGKFQKGLARTLSGDLVVLSQRQDIPGGVDDMTVQSGITADQLVLYSNLDVDPTPIAMATHPTTGLVYLLHTTGVVKVYTVGSLTASQTITTGITNATGITFDHNGNMIISKSGTPGTIYKFAGTSLTVTSTIASPANAPFGLLWYTAPAPAVSADRFRIYITDNNGHSNTSIVEIVWRDINGNPISTVGATHFASSEYASPYFPASGAFDGVTNTMASPNRWATLSGSAAPSHIGTIWPTPQTPYSVDIMATFSGTDQPRDFQIEYSPNAGANWYGLGHVYNDVTAWGTYENRNFPFQ